MLSSSLAPKSGWGWVLPWALCALSLPVFFYGLGDYGIVNNDEGFYHYVARQMARSGNWFRLVFVGEHRPYDTFMNAPWQYWIQALLILILGDDYWSMRLLSASGGLLTVLMTYRLAAWLAGSTAGVLAGLVQLTTMQFVHLHSARTAELDAILAFLFTLIAYLFLRALETGRSFISHHACLALLLGIKLPVIIMPLAAEAIFFALCPRARRRWRDWTVSALWVLPLGLLWHVGQALAHWDDFLVVMGSMRKEAGASEAKSLLGHLLVNGRFYGRTLVFGTFPWVAAYPFAVWSVLRGATPEARERWGLLALFAAAVLGFFLLVGKANHWYVLPAYPFLSAFTGLWLARLLRERPGVAALLACSIVLALVVWLRLEITDFNPYAQIARRAPMLFAWRGLADLGPTVGVPLTAAAVLLALVGVRQVGKALPGSAGGILLAVLLAVASWRTLRPLAFTDYQSEMERTYRALRDTRETVAFPVPIHERGDLKVKYYFADDYRIQNIRGRGRSGVYYLLYPKSAREDARGDGGGG